MTYQEAKALKREVDHSRLEVEAYIIQVLDDFYELELRDPWADGELMATISSRREWEEWRFEDIRLYGPPAPAPMLPGIRRGTEHQVASDDLPF